jgi:hypothetical protein
LRHLVLANNGISNAGCTELASGPLDPASLDLSDNDSIDAAGLATL